MSFFSLFFFPLTRPAISGIPPRYPTIRVAIFVNYRRERVLDRRIEHRAYAIARVMNIDFLRNNITRSETRDTYCARGEDLEAPPINYVIIDAARGRIRALPERGRPRNIRHIFIILLSGGG